METKSETSIFIEDAIKGGWKPVDEIMPKYFLWRMPFKVFVAGHLCSLYFETDVANTDFISYIHDGKTIEEALAAIK